jgi:hypothetical protein
MLALTRPGAVLFELYQTAYNVCPVKTLGLIEKFGAYVIKACDLQAGCLNPSCAMTLKFQEITRKLMSMFEAIMLLCFGASWPFSIAKALRTKVVEGKSPLFMTLVAIGYLSGVIHKSLYSFDWITLLYAVNLIMVVTDLTLYYRYLPATKFS